MQRCVRTWRGASETLGPASGAGAVWTHLVRPCAEALGWMPQPEAALSLGGVPMRVAEASLGPVPQLLAATPWGVAQEGLQRAATKLAAQRDTRWVAVCNGQSWRWYDASRPYAREHVAIDLAQASIDARVWQVLWLLGQPARSARTAGATEPWLERLLSVSAGESAGAAAVLRDGVSSALAELALRADGNHDTHVMLVFQWLFLLFAESRGLLPTWHPAYRRSYALSSLAREAVGSRPSAVGVHESLVAIGRLGREGATLGGLTVRALGGRLFAGSLAARRPGRFADVRLGRVLAHLTHGSGGRTGPSIDFGEFGVEHLGSLYERLMSPPAAPGAPALQRKRTGAFYTPRLLADMLVARTLDPLVRGASSREILGLRVLDPAMGSGALLASAMRYLVAAVESAWIREGRGGPLDVPRDERESLPRCIAEQCLYGVDVNARAVDVARLSIWLLSMAPDRPLTWLDAHLRLGNSLIGASPSTILSRVPARDRLPRRRGDAQLTLFDLEQWHHEAAEVGPLLAALAARPTDSAAAAGDKARALASLRSRKVLAAWRARADAWCGAAMDEQAVSGGTWRAVDEALRMGTAQRAEGGLRLDAHADRWQALADRQHCLHWSLEFPDIFESGRHGFDAVIANPPWEMLRGDLGSFADRAAARTDMAPLQRFVRRSGLYREVGGHVNSYQLFLERMLQLVRAGGRLGCLAPGGMLVDHGAAPLRRHLLNRISIDQLSVFDNRDALFPIHRSVRIVAMTGTSGGPTDAMLVDDGVMATSGMRPGAGRGAPRLLPRALLRDGSGELEAVPSVRNGDEVRLLTHLLSFPRLGGVHWHLRFGRELNATEDKALLRDSPLPDGGLAVVDGKHLQAFAVSPMQSGPWISAPDASRALPDQRWRQWRLAYRDVSSATNLRSLIAALLPPACVSTHTIFCLRVPLGLRTQLYLCGMLNSLAADWFVRRYMGGHVTASLIGNLPVPHVPMTHPLRRRVVRLTVRLMREPLDEHAQSELQAVAATLYDLDVVARATVAADFPRLSPVVRNRLLRAG